MTSPHIWTPAENALLEQCILEELPILVIAARFGVSRWTVTRQSQALELTHPRSYKWHTPKGQPTPPPAMDLMHREPYSNVNNGNFMHSGLFAQAAFMDCPREGGLDFKLCPSRQAEAAAVYRDHSHP